MPDAATATLAEPLLPASSPGPAPRTWAAVARASPPRDRTADASPSPRGRGDGGPGSAAGVGGTRAAGASPPAKAGPDVGSAGAAAKPAAMRGAAADDDDDGSGGAFDCNVCYDVAREPVVTLCGHLYCWPCLYRWMQVQSHCRACPVCKAGIDEDRVIPIYGRGGDQADPRKDGPGSAAPPAGKGGEEAAAAAAAAATAAAGAVPRRPPGQHTPAGPPPGSAAPPPPLPGHLTPGLGLIPTLFGLGPGGGGVVGAGYAGPGAGAAGGGPHPPGLDLSPEQQHQAFLSRLLLMLGSFVIMCLLLF